jgi:hypothetical protein
MEEVSDSSGSTKGSHMPLSPQEIGQIKSVTGSSLKSLLPLAGIGAPQALAVQFGVELLFRGIILGFQIKEVRDLAQQERNKIAAGRGIPYWPMPVSTIRQDVRRFFVEQRVLFNRRFPLLFEQLSSEVDVFEKGNPPEKVEEAFRVLAVARNVVSHIYDSKQFEDRSLQEVFEIHLKADPPQYAALAREYARLRGDFSADLTLESYASLLAQAYLQARLTADDAIQEHEIEQVEARLRQKVKDLWFNFAFGERGLVSETASFVLGFSKEELNEEKQRREKRIATLQQSNHPEKDKLIQEQRRKISRIDELLQTLG